jgi:hypothetical protein
MNVGRYLRGEDLHVGTSRITKPKELKMNERIKQLALQAGLDLIHDKFMTASQEKFAELIVQECAKIADVADENECEWIGGNILTHFGVKE